MPILPSGKRSRSVVMAMVLGTAMATMGEAKASLGTTRANDQTITDISRYCQACWRNARLPEDRWGDCTQQVFTRLLERVEVSDWGSVLGAEGDERKELLRAIDAVKKRTQRSRKFAMLSDDQGEWRNTDELRDRREALAFASQQVLSVRQRQIVELSVKGWAVPEIADELGTTVERVSDEKYKAIRKLRTHFGGQ
jgi:RNA polymerase sigma factor (sigma-70 family)